MATSTLSYPTPARNEEAGDTWHDTFFPDPYRALEDPDAEDTRAWIHAVNDVYAAHASQYTDQRNELRQHMDESFNYPKVHAVWQVGQQPVQDPTACAWQFSYNPGLSPQPIVYYTKDLTKVGQPEDPECVCVLDVNKEFPAGTTAYSGWTCSPDGKLSAHLLADAGSDWKRIVVRKTATGELLSDQVSWVKFSGISWAANSAGFFYCRYDQPAELAHGKSAGTEVQANMNHQLFYHAVGTEQAADKLVYATGEEEGITCSGIVSHDGQYLMISKNNGCDPVNTVEVMSLGSEFKAWVAGTGAKPAILQLVPDFDAAYDYLASKGQDMWFRTNKNAPRYKVIHVRLPEPGADAETCAAAVAAATDVVPQAEGTTLLQDVVVAREWLICTWLKDVVNQVDVRPLTAEPTPAAAIKPVELPAPGSVHGIDFEPFSTVGILQFTSMVHPSSVMRAAISSEGDLTLDELYTAPVPNYDPAQFESEQCWATGKDGTRIPYFLVRRKGTAGTPKRTILYGYGGFNISLTPYFSAIRPVWLKDCDGVYVMACLRGGGEFGEEWHKAGSLLQKLNTFDDLAAVAEHLAATRVTTPEQLAVMGGSNGGLLTLASSLRTPHLWAAAISQVPVADMARFHKFTIGGAWKTDYGCVESSAEFAKYLRGYSPLHNVGTVDASFPAVLICTADHDDRVVPLHSFKMAATLQHAAAPDARPQLIRIDVDAGHGAGKPTSKSLDEIADIYAFLWHQLGGASA